ncbi:hypothetical protein LJB88_05185, partial [Erysipelotrichaceae bacterium OttesenSCG-928-M19]|nr:hypothetical protein [Erysipelotrichaceae bacterium OttesenSCG-928-M19]
SYTIILGVKEDPSATVEVVITVIDKDENAKGKYYEIAANNIIVGTQDAQDMIDEDEILIEKAEAEAWIINMYETKGTVKVSDKEELKAEVGTYEVEFLVSEDHSAKVKTTVEVREEGRVDVGEEYMLVANDIEIDTRQASTITEEEIMELAKAQAWLLEDETKAGTVKVEENTVAGNGKGTYKVTLYVEEEPETKVEITVKVVSAQYGVINVLTRDMKDKSLPLAAAEYELLDQSGNVVRSGIVSRANGKVAITGLEDGTYYIVQTKAPEGYYLSGQKNRVVIVVGKVVDVNFLNLKK